MGRPKKETTVKPEEVKPAGLFEIDGEDEPIVAVEPADETHPLAVAALVESTEPGIAETISDIVFDNAINSKDAGPIPDCTDLIDAFRTPFPPADFVRPLSCGPSCSFTFDECAEGHRIVRESFGNSYRCVGCGGEFSALLTSGRCPTCDNKIGEAKPQEIRETFTNQVTVAPVYEPPVQEVPMQRIDMNRNNPIFDAQVNVDNANHVKELSDARRKIHDEERLGVRPESLRVVEVVDGVEVEPDGDVPDVTVVERRKHDA